MSDSWLPQPRLLPHRCHRRFSDGPADGPYFEEQFLYSEAGGGDDRELTLYHSAAWIAEMCGKPGSPFDLAPAGTLERQSRLLETLEADREALRERIRVLEDTLGAVPPVPERPQVDAGELAERLTPLLDARYARKPGPKRRVA